MTTIHVEIQEQDGTYFATSEEVPGFLLVNTDKAALHADILPAMKQLLAFKEQHSNAAVLQRKPSKRLVERVELVAA